jgi:hypothetical protein
MNPKAMLRNSPKVIPKAEAKELIATNIGTRFSVKTRFTCSIPKGKGIPIQKPSGMTVSEIMMFSTSIEVPNQLNRFLPRKM